MYAVPKYKGLHSSQREPSESSAVCVSRGLQCQQQEPSDQLSSSYKYEYYVVLNIHLRSPSRYESGIGVVPDSLPKREAGPARLINVVAEYYIFGCD